MVGGGDERHRRVWLYGEQFSMGFGGGWYVLPIFILYSSYIRPIFILYKSYINPLEWVVNTGVGGGEAGGWGLVEGW